MPRGICFCYLTNGQIPEATPKQSHWGTVPSIIRLGPVLENHWAALQFIKGLPAESPSCCALISVPRQGAQACLEGCPQVYQTSALSITRCTHVFSLTATSDFAIPSCKVTRAHSPCILSPLCPTAAVPVRCIYTHWGCVNQAQSCAWQRAWRVHSNPGSHSRTSLTQTRTLRCIYYIMTCYVTVIYTDLKQLGMKCSEAAVALL